MLNLTAKQLAAEIAAKRVSSVEVAEFFLKRINTLGKTLNAFISVNAETTLAAAKAADAQIAAGKADPRRRDDRDGEQGLCHLKTGLRHQAGSQAAPTRTAVEQWYSMLCVPKHQMMSLLVCGT